MVAPAVYPSVYYKIKLKRILFTGKRKRGVFLEHEFKKKDRKAKIA